VLTRVDFGRLRVGVQPRLHFIAAPEEGNGLSFDQNRSPRPGISPGAGFPKLYRKNSKSPQLYPVTAGHRSGNLCEDGIDDLLGTLSIEIGFCTDIRLMSSDLITAKPSAVRKVARIAEPVKHLLLSGRRIGVTFLLCTPSRNARVEWCCQYMNECLSTAEPQLSFIRLLARKCIL